MTATKKQPAAKRKPGRPTKYSDKLAATICTRLAEGESLRKVCADDDMPAISTVMGWLFDGEHGGFSEQFARAREAQAELRADEIIDIADDSSGDITRSRLRMDSRKWVASKLLPKLYGDRLQHTGEGGGPIRVRPDLSKLTEEELDVLERILGRASDA